MNGFTLLLASFFIYFTSQILDVGFCDATNLRSLQRDPNKQLSYAKFMEHIYHVLDVPKIEGVAVRTGSQCLLRCVNDDRCFSTNIGAFYLPNGKLWCDLLPTDKYNTSEKFKTNHTFHHYSITVSISYWFIAVIVPSVLHTFCSETLARGCTLYVFCNWVSLELLCCNEDDSHSDLTVMLWRIDLANLINGTLTHKILIIYCPQ